MGNNRQAESFVPAMRLKKSFFINFINKTLIDVSKHRREIYVFLNREKWSKPKKYENFSNRILPALVQTPNKFEIWSALLSAAGVKAHLGSAKDRQFIDLAKVYFQLGPYPEINPMERSEFDYAWWSPDKPLIIFINQKIIEEYENDSPHIKADEFITTVILHEFVHSLDYQHDHILQDKPVPRGETQNNDAHGDDFEVNAFGSRALLWKSFIPKRQQK
jgi:hypothetical protein